MKALFLLAMLLPLAVGAQIRKYQIDNKTIYNNSQYEQQNTVINTTANTIDSSGLREQAQRNRDDARRQQETAAMDSQRASLAANPPAECRFKTFKNGDAKGRILSQKAQDECIQNIVNTQNGLPSSRDAYATWKDHHERVSAARRQTICTTTGFRVGDITTGTAVCN